MSREAVVAAGSAAVRAALPGEKVSLIWESDKLVISFNWDRGWFWAAYDRKAGRLAGSGRTPTIEAACAQAWAMTHAPVLAAAE